MLTRTAFNLVRRVSNAIFGSNLFHRSAVVRSIYLAFQKINQALHPGHRAWRKFLREYPDAPWLVPESVKYLEGLICPGMQVLEWGSGRSTVWLAERGARLVSIEGDYAWYVKVSSKLKERNLLERVELRFAEASTFESYTAPLAGLSTQAFDLVLVDGPFRNECLTIAPRYIRPGGILVLDNADRA